jgi:hypothetical protein
MALQPSTHDFNELSGPFLPTGVTTLLLPGQLVASSRGNAGCAVGMPGRLPPGAARRREDTVPTWNVFEPSKVREAESPSTPRKSVHIGEQPQEPHVSARNISG